jgi:hypothetical protein
MSLFDRVAETSLSIGTGAMTLSGAALPGMQTVAAAGVTSGGQIVGTFVDEARQWEVGVYTFGPGNTLARTEVLGSSTGGAAISWAAGTKTFFCSMPARLQKWPTGQQSSLIINGGFAVDQRNAGGAQTIPVGSLAYTVDRFYAAATGAAITGQRVAAGGGAFRYRLTGAPGNAGFVFGQRISAANCAGMASGYMTLAADLRASSLTTLNWAIYGATSADTFGTIAAPTRTLIASGTWAVTAGISRLAAPALMGASAANGVELVISGGALAAGATVEIGNVRFEPGQVATPFVAALFEDDLRRAQAYYEKSYGLAVVPGSNIIGSTGSAVFIASNSNVTGAEYTGSIQFKVTKRTAPSIVIWDLTGAQGRVSNDTANNGKAVGSGSLPTWSDQHLYTYDFALQSSSNNRAYWAWAASAEL